MILNDEGSPFLKKGKDGDVDDQDTVTILDEGEKKEGKPQLDEKTGEMKSTDNYIFTLMTKNGERKTSLNLASRIAFKEAYGKDTVNWVGKKATVHYFEVLNRCYFAPVGWTARNKKTEKGTMVVFDPPEGWRREIDDASEVFDS